ncbi:MAG: histidine phosphatase family protein [Pseudomonadota bacterium]
MKRLMLMRHAKTEPWFQGTDDISRALLPRGYTDTSLIGKYLVASKWRPDRVLVSTARRTRETWGGLAPLFPGAEAHLLDDLYLTGTRGIDGLVRAHEDVKTLMIIGHNPGIHDFACQILREAGTQDQPSAQMLFMKMPTGATALFEAGNDRSFDPVDFPLAQFVRPKALRAGD